MKNDIWFPDKEDIRFFEENGYWTSPKLFDDKTLENLINRMEALHREEYETGMPPKGVHWKYGDDPKKIRKSSNAHYSDSALYALATNPTLGAIVATFLNARSIRLFNTQLLYKPGRGSETNLGNVGWHQDLQYWQFTERPTVMTAWVAFNDVTVENGCMQMVPGSHKWGLQNTGSFHDQDIEQQEKSLNEKLSKFKPVHVELKAGHVSFHHALTYHGSGRNISSGPRCSMAIHLMSGETSYKTGNEGWDKHAHIQSFHKLKDGDFMSGEDFPVIYERSMAVR